MYSVFELPTMKNDKKRNYSFFLRNGSVKVLFRIILKVKQPSTDTRNVVILRFGKKLNNQLNTGRLGNFWVVPEPFKLAGI